MGIAGEKATKYPKPRADMGIAGEKVSKYPKYKANMGITRKKQANTQNIATAWVCQTEKSPHTHSETQYGYGEEKSCHIPTNIESERVLQAKRQAKYPKYRANMGITRKKRPNAQNLELTWVLQERSKQIPKT